MLNFDVERICNKGYSIQVSGEPGLSEGGLILDLIAAKAEFGIFVLFESIRATSMSVYADRGMWGK